MLDYWIREFMQVQVSVIIIFLETQTDWKFRPAR
jgi:hypothetical protein